MRGLSLYQPWASAIAAGLKTIETRSWSTSYRGPIAIHAAKKWTGEMRGTARDLLAEIERIEPIRRSPSSARADRLPRGFYLAVAELCECFPITRSFKDTLSPLELALGNYAINDCSDAGHRYAWRLRNVRALRAPVAAGGQRGLYRIADGTTRVVDIRDHGHDRYIGRRMPRADATDGYFGNPYTVREHGTAALWRYYEHFRERIVSDPAFRERLEKLRGKTLGCWCAPGPCHGDVIAAYLNQPALFA